MTVASTLSKVAPKGLKLPTANSQSTQKPPPTTPGLKTPKTPQDEALAYFSSQESHTGEPVQVWELWLEDDGGPDEQKSYIRLPAPTRPYVLRLSLHPGTSCARNGVLKSDFPMDGGVFERGVWKERKLPSDVSKPVHVDLPISAPGAFCYFIEYDTPQGTRKTGRRGYFNVDPLINLPARTPFFPSDSPDTNPLSDKSSGAILPQTANLHLDGLTILSVLAKWMGPTSSWEPHFSEASKRGYNMLHWAPLQHRRKWFTIQYQGSIEV